MGDNNSIEKKQRELDLERSKRDGGITVTLVDDEPEHYKSQVEENLFPVTARTFDLGQFERILNGSAEKRRQNGQEAAAKMIKSQLGDILIFDGSYSSGNLSTVKACQKLIKEFPEYADRVTVLIGKDITEQLRNAIARETNPDRKFELQYQFNGLYNTPHTEYTDKTKKMTEWILDKSKQLDYPTEKQMEDKGPIRPELIKEIIDINKINAEMAKLHERLSHIYDKINRTEPKTENERMTLTLTKQAEVDLNKYSHSLGQKRTWLEYMEVNQGMEFGTEKTPKVASNQKQSAENTAENTKEHGRKKSLFDTSKTLFRSKLSDGHNFIKEQEDLK